MEANYFTILYWFCHTSTLICHRYIRVSHPEPHSYLPPQTPSGSCQCTSPERPVSCIEPGLAIYFTYGNIHVSMLSSQCYSLRLLPQSPKVYSLHLCLLCCLAYRVIVTIFLNSIYMSSYTVLVFFFLTYITLYNRFQFHPHLIRTDSNTFFLIAE